MSLSSERIGLWNREAAAQTSFAKSLTVTLTPRVYLHIEAGGHVFRGRLDPDKVLPLVEFYLKDFSADHPPMTPDPRKLTAAQLKEHEHG